MVYNVLKITGNVEKDTYVQFRTFIGENFTMSGFFKTEKRNL